MAAEYFMTAPEQVPVPGAPIASYAPAPPPVPGPMASSMPPQAMSSAQYGQAALAASASQEPPQVSMVATPAITKKRPQDISPEEARAYYATALPGATGHDSREGDVSASVSTPLGQVVGYTRGSAGGERSDLGQKASSLQSKKYDVQQDAAFKNQLTSIVQAEGEEELWRKEALKQQTQIDAIADQKQRRAQELQALRDDMDQRSQELAKTVIDPERKQNSRSFGTNLMNGIAAGLLAFGNGAAGAEVVMRRIQAENEADVQSQKDQWLAKQQGLKGKETIFERMMQQYGNEDDAEAATRLVGLEQAKMEAQAWGAKSKGLESQKAYNDLHGQLEAHRFDELQKHMKMVSGRAPTRLVQLKNGAVVQMNEAQYTNYAMQNETANDAGSRSVAGAVATERTKAEVSKGTDLDKQAQDYGKEVSKDAPALSTLNDVEAALRANEITGAQRVTAAAGIQSPMLRKLLHGEGAANRDQVVSRLKAQVISDISGSGVSEGERKNLTDMIQGAGDTESILNSVRIARNTITNRHKSLEGGYMPEAVQLYRSRTGAAQMPDASIRAEE